jgi:hypothetical protein
VANLLNDTSNWCLGRPRQTQLINSYSQTDGGIITRTTNRSWDAIKCRQTQEVAEPGSAQWQVTTDYVYDDFAATSGIAVAQVADATGADSTITQATNILADIATGESIRKPWTVSRPIRLQAGGHTPIIQLSCKWQELQQLPVPLEQSLVVYGGRRGRCERWQDWSANGRHLFRCIRSRLELDIRALYAELILASCNATSSLEQSRGRM